MSFRAIFAGNAPTAEAERTIIDALRSAWDNIEDHAEDLVANLYTEHHGTGDLVSVADGNPSGTAAPTTDTTTEANTAGPASVEQTAAGATPDNAPAPGAGGGPVTTDLTGGSTTATTDTGTTTGTAADTGTTAPGGQAS